MILILLLLLLLLIYKIFIVFYKSGNILLSELNIIISIL
jgi:hypothetical protein